MLRKFFIHKTHPIFLLLIFLFSCASPIPPSPQVEQGHPDAALPDELRERFNVKDVSDTELTEIDLKNQKEKKMAVKSEVPVPQVKKKAKEKKEEKKSVAKVVTLEIPNRRPHVEPTFVGEKLTYDVTYLGMSAGEFSLEVKPHKVVQERKVYHIQGEARSSKIFSLIYKLEDSLVSFIDFYGLFSHRFELRLNESKQHREAIELHDHAQKKTFYWDKWNHTTKGYFEKKEYSEIAPFSQDPISSLYYVRTLPLKVGDQYVFPVINEAKNWEAVVQVVKKEEIQTAVGKLKTIVIKPQMKFEGVIKQQGDSFMWLTDDDRRYLVRVEAKVKIGSVVGRVTSIQPGTP